MASRRCNSWIFVALVCCVNVLITNSQVVWTVINSTTHSAAPAAPAPEPTTLSPHPVKKLSWTTTNLGLLYWPGDLIFEEDFNTFNLSLWHHEITMEGGGNNEFIYYDQNTTNSFVQNGVLYILPSMTLDVLGGDYGALYNGYMQLVGCTDPGGYTGGKCSRKAWYPWIQPPVISARLRTQGSFSFTYGKVEIRAKLPSGDWTWPALWLLPENNAYGTWPASGEIDMAESRGNRKLFDTTGVNIGSEQCSSTMHFGPYWPYNGWWAAHGVHNTPVDQGYDRDFHLYQLDWTPTHITISIDNTVVKKVTPPSGGFFELGQFPSTVANPWIKGKNVLMAPFDQPFHFMLNVAVGGNYFPPDSTPAPPWGGQPFLDFLNAESSWGPSWANQNAAMQVDYIRVWAI